MHCSKIKRRLSAYLDGELDTVKKENIESHLRDCQACQHDLAILNQSWHFLDSLPEPEPPLYFYTRLKARLSSAAKEKRESWVERALIPVSAVVVVALGIFMGSIVGKNGKRLAQEVPAEENVISSLYLDHFDDFPSASLGEVFINLAFQE
ncbi:MAG: zf-HC2 domain-containing protein [bacterium]